MRIATLILGIVVALIVAFYAVVTFVGAQMVNVWQGSGEHGPSRMLIGLLAFSAVGMIYGVATTFPYPRLASVFWTAAALCMGTAAIVSRDTALAILTFAIASLVALSLPTYREKQQDDAKKSEQERLIATILTTTPHQT